MNSRGPAYNNNIKCKLHYAGPQVCRLAEIQSVSFITTFFGFNNVFKENANNVHIVNVVFLNVTFSFSKNVHFTES